MAAEHTSQMKLVGPSYEVANGLALMLETACEDYEIMEAVLRQKLIVEPSNSIMNAALCGGARAPFRIAMALARSFIFFTVRARRICEHKGDKIFIPRDIRIEFVRKTKAVLQVRDVIEHGFDGKASSPVPTPYHHEECFIDETSMNYLSPDKILIGKINLAEMYHHVKAMRDRAGFTALSRFRRQAL